MRKSSGCISAGSASGTIRPVSQPSARSTCGWGNNASPPHLWAFQTDSLELYTSGECLGVMNGPGECCRRIGGSRSCGDCGGWRHLVTNSIAGYHRGEAIQPHTGRWGEGTMKEAVILVLVGAGVWLLFRASFTKNSGATPTPGVTSRPRILNDEVFRPELSENPGV